jgi:hypothetical protein
MRRTAMLFVVLAASACGSKQTPRDLCLHAIKEGPPPATPECAEGTELQSALAPPSRLSRIPGPGAGRTGTEPAERRWCAGPGGIARGAYVALDRSGQVVESGRYNRAGQLDGPWIVWAGAAPRAVGHYRDGESISLETCDLGR